MPLFLYPAIGFCLGFAFGWFRPNAIAAGAASLLVSVIVGAVFLSQSQLHLIDWIYNALGVILAVLVSFFGLVWSVQVREAWESNK